MKKKLIFVLALTLILIIATFIYLHFVGNIYTKSIETYIEGSEIYNFQNINISYTDNTIVKNTKQEIKNNILILSFKGLKNGTTEAEISYTVNGIQETETLTLTTGFLGIVYGEHDTSDFCGGESIIVSLIIFIIAIITMSLFSIIHDIKIAKYSYSFINNIAIFIVCISTLIICIFEFHLFLETPYNDYRGLNPIYESLISGINMPTFLFFPVFIVFTISIIISNISLIKHEGKGFTNMFGIILSLIILCGYIILYVLDEGNNNRIHIMISTLYDSAFFFCESIFIGTVIAGLAAAKHKIKYNKDFIIINGCGICKDGTLSPLLRGRVDKAIEFYNKQRKESKKAAILIPSGGQGLDEPKSEARAMKEYLINKKIPEKNIIIEDKSTTTLENMQYSKQIIDTIKKDAKVAFVTTNYHVFRAGIYASEIGLDAKGIGSKTKWYFWPNAFIREFIGMLEHYKLKLLLEFSSVMIFIFILESLAVGKGY